LAALDSLLIATNFFHVRGTNFLEEKKLMRQNLVRWIDDDFFAPLWNEAWKTKSVAHFTPPVDVEEHEDHFFVTLDTPGVKREDIQVRLENNHLIISGERKQETKTEKGSSRMFERAFGKFERSFELGTDVNASKIEAAYKDGVLTITVPKAEAVKPKLIEVKTIN
jgi:HSP20 family protein